MGLFQKLCNRLPLQAYIAGCSIAAIVLHLFLRFFSPVSTTGAAIPLILTIVFGGALLLRELIQRLFQLKFGSDLLAGISILTSLFLGEYLAGTIVVLMLSGGEALERFAVTRASSVLNALAKRMPQVAHRRSKNFLEDIPTETIAVGDTIVVFPHELCPVDGTVIEGEGVMDESFLTGEPFMIRKTAGSDVISGAINGEAALAIETTRRSIDSRYAKIMRVMQEAELNRPPLRRLGDKLGALYTPLALSMAIFAWVASNDATRFLSVLVVATPCPLLIAIPVALISAISLAAKRGIIIKNPALLEQLTNCRTILFDKTGTLTYGKPELVDISTAARGKPSFVLQLAASVERYSKHPLSKPILERAQRDGIILESASEVSEKPGQGLSGIVSGHTVEVTSRNKLLQRDKAAGSLLPPARAGLESVILVDGAYAATFSFHDTPRSDSKSFIKHLGPKHNFRKVMLVSGDRESEVQYLGESVGIKDVYFNQSPEDKVALVRRENESGATLFLGDGINDAPALAAATVGIALGQNSEITSEAAAAVIMEANLTRVDELFHIGHRMYRIALESALGGMLLSIIGMVAAATGYLSPVAGAVSQEFIDLFAVLNALRAGIPPRSLSDYRE